MQEEKKRNLSQKKEELQIRLQVRESCRLLEQNWLTAYASLQQQGVSFSIRYLACAGEAEKEAWHTELRNAPWRSMNIHDESILRTDVSPVHEQLFSLYPGVLPLRYLPDLQTYVPDTTASHRQILAELKTRLSLEDPVVLLFFTRFTPVIRLRYNDLLATTDNEWMLSLEDVCISAEDLSWLIFCSMEDEWRYGRNNEVQA